MFAPVNSDFLPKKWQRGLAALMKEMFEQATARRARKSGAGVNGTMDEPFRAERDSNRKVMEPYTRNIRRAHRRHAPLSFTQDSIKRSSARPG